MKRKVSLIASVTVAVFLLSGCARRGDMQPYGFFFTYTKVPFTKDLNNTPISPTHADGKVIHIKETFFTNIYGEFSSNAIGDIAKKHGINEVYFADLETFNIFLFFFIIKYQKIHIYGK